MTIRSSARKRSWPTWKQPRDVEPLRRAVRQARKAGDLDARLAEARGKLARAEKKAATALAQLPGWNRSAEDLERLAVPLSATLDQFESQLPGNDAGSSSSLAERLAAEDDSIRQLETRLQSLELQQDVPTEEVLLAARKRREQGWRLVKAAWLDGAPDGRRLAAFLAEFAPEGRSPSAYEQSVQRGDALADRLRREADRVAHKAESLAQLNRHRSHARGARTTKAGCSMTARPASTETGTRWSAPLGIEAEARTPAELRAWLRQREEVVQLLEKVEEARQSLEPLEQAFSTQRAAMSRALDEVGEPLSTIGLRPGRSAGAGRGGDQAARRPVPEDGRSWKPSSPTARAERATAELSLQTAETELTAWRTEWSAMMARIGLEAEAAPEQAEVFLTKIGELLEKLNDRRESPEPDSRHRPRRRRVRAGRRGAGGARRPGSGRSAGRRAGARAGPPTARRAGRRPEMHHADPAATARRGKSPRGRDSVASEAQVCLERLCKEAGCTDFDDLPEAERRSQNRARLEADRAACEEQLMVAAAGADLATFRRRGRTGRSRRAGRDRSKSSSQRSRPRKKSCAASTRPSAPSGRNWPAWTAATAPPRPPKNAQTLLARLQGDVARYATLKLAAAVLHRGIERYREKNQGPILARAGVLFAGLTGGSFARLQIDDDGDGRSVLKGVRPDGRLVGVEGMSDGSHDQLYLALRLASLESWLQSHEPIPFVVDDILLNFDDRRATAAPGRPGRAVAANPGPVLHAPSPHHRPGPYSSSPRGRLRP